MKHTQGNLEFRIGMYGFLLLFLGGCSHTIHAATYTGYASGWSDNLNDEPRTYPPVKIHWTEASDSSWAVMEVSFAYNREDTLEFKHQKGGDWMLIRENSNTSIHTLGHPTIHLTADSIVVALGFGYSGVAYYARKD